MQKRALFIDGPAAGEVTTINVGVDDYAPSEIVMPGPPTARLRATENLNLDFSSDYRKLWYKRLPGIYPFYIVYYMNVTSSTADAATLAVKMIELSVEQNLAETTYNITKKYDERMQLLERRLGEFEKTLNSMKFLANLADALKDDQ